MTVWRLQNQVNQPRPDVRSVFQYAIAISENEKSLGTRLPSERKSMKQRRLLSDWLFDFLVFSLLTARKWVGNSQNHIDREGLN